MLSAGEGRAGIQTFSRTSCCSQSAQDHTRALLVGRGPAFSSSISKVKEPGHRGAERKALRTGVAVRTRVAQEANGGTRLSLRLRTTGVQRERVSLAGKV